MQAVGRPYLSIVVPAYNEEQRLGESLAASLKYLDEQPFAYEFVLVDDGSSDGTVGVAREVLRDRPAQLLRNDENRGKGYSVRRGVLAATGRWVLITDADFSTPIEEHATLARLAQDQDLDVVIGSRALPGSRVEIRQKPIRELMGKSFGALMRAVTGLRFRDTQCGFKLMDRKRVEPLFRLMVVDRFAFDVELLFLADRFGLSIREAPVIWRNSPQSKVSMIVDPINMLWDVFRIRWRFRCGAYNPEADGR